MRIMKGAGIPKPFGLLHSYIQLHVSRKNIDSFKSAYHALSSEEHVNYGVSSSSLWRKGFSQGVVALKIRRSDRLQDTLSSQDQEGLTRARPVVSMAAGLGCEYQWDGFPGAFCLPPFQMSA